MRIDSSVIGMESARSYTSISSQAVAFKAVSVTSPATTDGNTLSFSDFLNGEKQDVEELSLQDRLTSIAKSRSVSDFDEQKSIETIKLQCLQYLLFLIFGGHKPERFEEMMKKSSCDDELATANQEGNTVQNVLKVRQEITYTSYFAESEQTSFSTTGTVRTADGREINFNLDMSMSRSFEQYVQTNDIAETIQMMDPLVINLDGNVAGLSDQKFEFDLDCDGTLDTISMLQKGSGYLALDKNGDGIINDGSELFGTKSGDGFKDLAIYDKDQNGWIDENDEIFDKLMIWSKDEEGNDTMYTLKEAGVGAIALQKVQTDFSLNSLKDNNTNGAIRSTGIFLYENGNVGSLQQVDLAV